MIIEDLEHVQTQMNGNQFKAANFAHSLRAACWTSVFGMKYEQVMDPLDSNLWKEIDTIVENNTNIYRKVFGCFPDNSISSYNEIEELKSKKNLNLYSEMRNDIKGFAVEWPMDFLIKEDLQFKAFEKEGLTPEYNFT